MKPNGLPPPAQLIKFIVEKWISKPIYAAAELGMADILSEGANSHRAILDVYNFSGINTLTDVDGGLGALLAEILIANPLMNGVVADIPPVIQRQKK